MFGAGGATLCAGALGRRCWGDILREGLRAERQRGDHAGKDERRCRTLRALAKDLSDPAGQEEHHQRVEREQPQRRQQHRAAQVQRLADLVGLKPRAQWAKSNPTSGRREPAY